MLFDEEYIAKTYRRDLLSQGREEGRREGQQEGMLNTLRSLLPATGMPLEQALTLLNIPEPDRPVYREILREQ